MGEHFPENALRVYVIGAYTRPDPCENTHRAIKLGDELAGLGFAPFVPHLTHLWHTVSPKPVDFWYQYDLIWLRTCDAVLWDRTRCPGASRGGDAEWAEAVKLGKPCFSSVDDLLAWKRRVNSL